MPPVIGVNTSLHGRSEKSWRATVGNAYIEAVEKSGAIPIGLLPVASASEVAAQLSRVDAVVTIGGYDLDPKHYGQKYLSTTILLNPLQGAYDFLLVKETLKSRKPFLAICLGFQTLNVALGGDLIQDLLFQYPQSTVNHYAKPEIEIAHHPVIVEEGTLLREIVGCGTLEVNSTHHQAVTRAGNDLIVSARAADGVIEAVEHPALPFFLGVQWHPEMLLDRTEHSALFEALVEAAGNQR